MSAVVRFLILGLFLIPFVTASYVYDTNMTISKFAFYDSSATSYTLKSTANVDLFPEDVEVNDMLYFGRVNPAFSWHNIHLDITTPVSATDFGVEWEYYSDYTWRDLPNVTDNCNNFTVSGACSILFPVPNNMRYNSWTDYYDMGQGATFRASWVRAKVVVNDSVTEGGRQSANNIEIADNTITISNEGALTFNSIYSAETTNNWGVVYNMADDMYYIDAHVYLKNSNLTSTNEAIQIGTADKQSNFYTDSASSVTIGALDTNGYGEDGSRLTVHAIATYSSYRGIHNFKLYGSQYYRPYGHYQSSGTFYGSSEIIDSNMMSKSTFHWPSTATASKFYRSVYDVSYYLYLYNGVTDIDQAMLTADGYGFLCGVGSDVIKNTDLRGMQVKRYYGADVTLVDCINIGTLSHNSPNGVGDYSIWLNNTIAFYITDEDNNPLQDAVINITNVYGNKVFSETTYSNGSTDIKSLSIYENMIWYNESWSTEHIKDFNPFNVTIEKEGYIPYNYQLNLTKKERLSYSLGTYPFRVDGVLNLTLGKSLRFMKCS